MANRTMSGSPGAGRACRIRRYSVNQLSAGQQRRVALARLWLTVPRYGSSTSLLPRLTLTASTSDPAYGAAYGAGGDCDSDYHQPLNVAESKIRRISLTQTRPHDVLAHFPS